MSDLTERLLLRRTDDTLFNPLGPEAADEIDRLTARVAELEKVLRSLSNYSADEDAMDWADTILEMNAIARAALTPQQGGE